jgi:hypothetical protein
MDLVAIRRTQFLDASLDEVDDADTRALLDVTLDDRAPDARAAPRDQRNLSSSQPMSLPGNQNRMPRFVAVMTV